jgi:tetratricopeptide (TPR) repeat protein
LNFSPDGLRLLSGGSDGVTRVWGAATGDEQAALRLADSITYSNVGMRAAWLGDSERIVTAHGDGTIALWDAAARMVAAHAPPDQAGSTIEAAQTPAPIVARRRLTLPGHSDSIFSLATTPDGRVVATGSFGGAVRFWHAAGDVDVLARTAFADRREQAVIDQFALASQLQKAERSVDSVAAFRRYRDLAADLSRQLQGESLYRRWLGIGHFQYAAELTSLETSQAAERACRDAISVIDQLKADFPNEPYFAVMAAQTQALLAGQLTTRGQPEDAIASYRQAAERFAPLVQRLEHDDSEFRLANCHWNIGNLQRRAGQMSEAETSFRQAVRNLERLVARTPQVAEYLQALAHYQVWLSRFLAEHQHWDEAQATVDQLARLDPVDPLGRDKLVKWLVRSPSPKLRRIERALAIGLSSVQSDMQRPGGWFALGQAFYFQSDWPAALVAFDRGASLNHQRFDADDALVAALAWWHVGQYDKARRQLTDMDALLRADESSDDPSQQALVAEARRLLDPANRAVATPALSANELLRQRGLAALRLKLYEDATQHFGNLTAILPNDAQAWCGLGQAQAALNRANDAERSFDAALERQANHTAARAGKAQLSIRRGDAAWRANEQDRAIAEFAAAVEIAPTDPAGWLARAVALNRQKKWEASAADFDKAIELDARLDDSIRRMAARSFRGLADALAGKRQWDQARARYDQSIELSERDLEGARTGLPYVLNELAWSLRLRSKLPQPSGSTAEGSTAGVQADIARAGETWARSLDEGKADANVHRMHLGHLLHWLSAADAPIFLALAQRGTELAPDDADWWLA